MRMWILFSCCVTGLAMNVYGQEARLFEQERFDRIVLTEDNGGKSFRVFPFPPGAVPKVSKTPLRVRLTIDPDRQFDIEWKHVKRIERFEDVLIVEVARLVRAGKLDTAHDTLLHLWETVPGWRGLKKVTAEFLRRDAAAAFRERDFETALVSLDAYSRLDPRAQRAFARVIETALQEVIDNGDFTTANQFLNWVAKRRHVKLSSQLTQWRAKLAEIAVRHVGEAKQFANSGKYVEALAKLRRAQAAQPDSEAARALLGAILAEYPRVTVGVTRLADDRGGYPREWATARDRRLESRRVLEHLNYSDNGGDFGCPIGEYSLDRDKRGIRLTLDKDAMFDLSGFELQRILLEPACASGAGCRPLWFRLMDGVRIEDQASVHARIRQPLLRWLPLLDFPLAQQGSYPQAMPYLRQRSVGVGQDTFAINDAYRWRVPSQPVEIVQRRYSSTTELLAAVSAGEIDVADRLLPADVNNLEISTNLRIGEYHFVSSYFLVPNPHKPLTQDRMFRRGILSGIDRVALLQRLLKGRREVPGCEVISGPFPAGRDTNDPINYGVDDQVSVRAYDPELAKALVTMAQLNHLPAADAETAAVAEGDEAPLPKVEPIVIACPQDATVIPMAKLITRNLSAHGLDVQLRILSDRESRPRDDQWDLWLVDLAMREPMLDIYAIFGAGGLTEPPVYIEQQLTELFQARLWSDARQSLNKIHRLVSSELTLIPLWQLTNHYAHRRRLQYVGESLVSLYQNIEQWQVSASR